MGLEAQELLRWQNIPVCVVKRRQDNWECACLELSGISTVTVKFDLSRSIDEVKRLCEQHLRTMGHGEMEKVT